MELLETINGNLLIRMVGLPLMLCVVVMLLNSSNRETSKLAIKNSFATLCVLAINIAAILVAIVPSVVAQAQAVYDALHVPQLPASFWDGVPWPVVALIALLALDIADYSIHRLMHRKWFWPAHAAHHSDTHVNAFTTYRVHFIEGILMSITYLVMFSWLHIPEQLPLAVLFSRVYNMYVHMDLPWDHGRLRYVMASPVFHRWHHVDTPAAHGKNLATMFPILDVMFGTYYPAQAHEVSSLPMGARSSDIADVNPLKIAIYPVMQWGRLLRGQWRKMTNPTPAAASSRSARPVEALVD